MPDETLDTWDETPGRVARLHAWYRHRLPLLRLLWWTPATLLLLLVTLVTLAGVWRASWAAILVLVATSAYALYRAAASLAALYPAR